MKESLLSPAEWEVLENLKNAWDKFLELEKLHPDHQTEFRHAIHRAEDIVLSRPVLREVKKMS